MVARRSDGTLWCWGFDDMGVCGGGSFPWAQPSDVDCVSDFSVDGFAVAQHPDGSLTVWGGSTTFVYGENPALELAQAARQGDRGETAGGVNLRRVGRVGDVVVQGKHRLHVEDTGMASTLEKQLSQLPFAPGARRLGRGCMPCVIYDDGHAECIGLAKKTVSSALELDAAREPVALPLTVSSERSSAPVDLRDYRSKG
jgi:hypothetical protein